MADLEEAAKSLNEIAKKYNPLDNEIKFKDGKFSWKVDPKLSISDLDKSKFGVKLEKDLSDNFEMTIDVEGNFALEDLDAKLEFKLRF